MCILWKDEYLWALNFSGLLQWGIRLALCQWSMMTSSNGNIFLISLPILRYLADAWNYVSLLPDNLAVYITVHDDVIKWKHFPRYWPFVRGIRRSPVNSPHKGQWRGALMFSLICARINDWVIIGEAGIETPSCPLWRHCNGDPEIYGHIPWDILYYVIWLIFCWICCIVRINVSFSIIFQVSSEEDFETASYFAKVISKPMKYSISFAFVYAFVLVFGYMLPNSCYITVYWSKSNAGAVDGTWLF